MKCMTWISKWIGNVNYPIRCLDHGYWTDTCCYNYSMNDYVSLTRVVPSFHMIMVRNCFLESQYACKYVIQHSIFNKFLRSYYIRNIKGVIILNLLNARINKKPIIYSRRQYENRCMKLIRRVFFSFHIFLGYFLWVKLEWRWRRFLFGVDERIDELWQLVS